MGLFDDSGITSGQVGSVFGGIGGAVQGLFQQQAGAATAAGDEASAAADEAAARLARQNAKYSELSTELTSVQTQQQVNRVVGKGEAQVSGSNLSGGSAEDIKRASLEQGFLAQAVIHTQGAINENSYIQQATALEGQATAAENAAVAATDAGAGAMFGGLLKLGGAAAALLI